MSYDLTITVPEWPSDTLPRWVAELKEMGISATFAAGFDPVESKGWCPVKISVVDPKTPLPLARTLAAKKSFESGFDYVPSEDRVMFSAKVEAGNAVAIWCAAALAAVVGGTLEDPQFDLSASGDNGLAVIAKLAEHRPFIASIAGPVAKVKTKAPPKPRALKATVDADPGLPVRAYGSGETFEVRERIAHPTFGEGVVEVSMPGKITVFFAGVRRVLVQAKT